MAIPDFNFDQDERADNLLLNDEGVIPSPQPEQTTTDFSPYSQDADTTISEPPVQQAEIVPEFKESEYLGGLLSPVPRPEKDETREKRLTAIAGARGVGKALSVLGDAYAVGQGGVVPVRKAGDEPAVAQIMEDNRRFREKMEEADFQDYMNKLRTGQAIGAAKGRERREEKADVRFEQAKELEAERHLEGVEAATAKAREDKRRYGIEGRMTGRKQTETERHNRAMEKLRSLTLFYSQYGGGGTIKGKYPLYDEDGKKITDVDDGQVDKLFDMIKNSVDIGEDLALLKSQLGEGITKEHKRTIVAAYSDLPGVAKFLEDQTGVKAPVSGGVPDWITNPLITRPQGQKAPITKEKEATPDAMPSMFN